jgi:(2Fe-2S) ferredoxin
VNGRPFAGGILLRTEYKLTDRHPGDPPLFFEFHVFVCTNRRPDGHPKGSCAERGSEKLRDYMKARARELGVTRVRINNAGCLDRCEHGPCIVVYPEGIWYRVGSPADVDLVLQQHIVSGGRATPLMLPAD